MPTSLIIFCMKPLSKQFFTFSTITLENFGVGLIILYLISGLMDYLTGRKRNELMKLITQIYFWLPQSNNSIALDQFTGYPEPIDP